MITDSIDSGPGDRKRTRALDAYALQTLFERARTAQGFLPIPIDRAMLERIVELAQWGPTANNSLPLRVVFVVSPEAKARLKPTLSEGNVEKTMAAPVTAILASDLAFFDHFPERFDNGARLRARFGAPDAADAARAFALQNATMQGAYVMLAARAFGLDVGPMGGFDRVAVDREFLGGTTFASQWLCNIGYADDAAARPRGPRFAVDEIATFV